MTISEIFFANHNSMRLAEYNNKTSEKVHSFDGVLNLEEIGIVKVSLLKKMTKIIKTVRHFFGTKLSNI